MAHQEVSAPAALSAARDCGARGAFARNGQAVSPWRTARRHPSGAQRFCAQRAGMPLRRGRCPARAATTGGRSGRELPAGAGCAGGLFRGAAAGDRRRAACRRPFAPRTAGLGEGYVRGRRLARGPGLAASPQCRQLGSIGAAHRARRAGGNARRAVPPLGPAEGRGSHHGKNRKGRRGRPERGRL